MTIKQVVEDILKEYPKTRDDDFLLCIHVYIRMGYAKKSSTSVKIDYKNLEFAPSFETITRHRRYFQHVEGRFKASEEIQEKRNIQEYSFREKYSRFNTYPNSWMT